jgi:hypothetical protein
VTRMRCSRTTRSGRTRSIAISQNANGSHAELTVLRLTNRRDGLAATHIDIAMGSAYPCVIMHSDHGRLPHNVRPIGRPGCPQCAVGGHPISALGNPVRADRRPQHSGPYRAPDNRAEDPSGEHGP